MEERTANIWELYDSGYADADRRAAGQGQEQAEEIGAPWLVVVAAVGWTTAGDGFMGRGVANEATVRWQDLLRYWGDICFRSRVHTRASVLWRPESKMRCIVLPYIHLHGNPAHTWRRRPSMELLEESLREAKTFTHEGTRLLASPAQQDDRMAPAATRDLIRNVLRGDKRWVLVEHAADMEAQHKRRGDALGVK